MIKPAAATLALVLIYGAITLVAESWRAVTVHCSECASERRDLSFVVVGTIFSEVKASKFTPLVKAVDPGPCAHRWVGGVCGVPTTWNHLRRLQDSGVLKSVMAVDPEGGVELVRWILRTDKAWYLFLELGDGRSCATRSEFRAWFDEFRRKAAGAP